MSTGSVGRLHVSANTAELMASVDKTGLIVVPEVRVVVQSSTRKKLTYLFIFSQPAILKRRGHVNIRGKGDMLTYWVRPGKKFEDIMLRRQQLKRARTLRRVSLGLLQVDNAPNNPLVASNADRADIGTTRVDAGDSTQVLTTSRAGLPFRLLNSHAAVNGAPLTVSGSGAAPRLLPVCDLSEDPVTEQLGACDTVDFNVLRLNTKKSGAARERRQPHDTSGQSVSEGYTSSALCVGQGALALQKLAGGYQPRSELEQAALEADLSRVLGGSPILDGGLQTIVRRVTQWRTTGTSFQAVHSSQPPAKLAVPASIPDMHTFSSPSEVPPSSTSAGLVRVSSWVHQVSSSLMAAVSAVAQVPSRTSPAASPLVGAVVIDLRDPVHSNNTNESLRPPFTSPACSKLTAGHGLTESAICENQASSNAETTANPSAPLPNSDANRQANSTLPSGVCGPTDSLQSHCKDDQRERHHQGLTDVVAFLRPVSAHAQTGYEDINEISDDSEEGSECYAIYF